MKRILKNIFKKYIFPKYVDEERLKGTCNQSLTSEHNVTKENVDELIPPSRLMFDGATNEDEFRSTGEGFTNYYLIGHAQLRPDDKILDIGCGIGQKARVLTKYLTCNGSYDGIDIVAVGIDWCKEKYKIYPNFNFQFADVYNKFYNPSGRYKASEYKFPYPSKSFDIIFLSSVFTHMLPIDMQNYLSEIARVLKQNGRCIATFFLLNPESLRRVHLNLNTIKVPFKYGLEGCLVADKDIPDITIAYDEQFVRNQYDKLGLNIVEITYGFWSGRKDLVHSLQDVIITIKE